MTPNYLEAMNTSLLCAEDALRRCRDYLTSRAFIDGETEYADRQIAAALAWLGRWEGAKHNYLQQVVTPPPQTSQGTLFCASSLDGENDD